MRHKFFARLLGISLIFLLFGACQIKAENELRIKDEMMASSVRLSIDYEDGRKGSCTATAFHKENYTDGFLTTHRFLTATHCVSSYNMWTLKTTLYKAKFQVHLEEEDGSITAYPAKVIAHGEWGNYQDFAVVEAELDRVLPVIPMADKPLELNENISMVTMPLEDIGNLFIRGYVSKREVYNDYLYGVNLGGSNLFQAMGLGTGEGASGSAVISNKQNAIAAILVVKYSNLNLHTTFYAIPISKFKKFYKEFLRDTYGLFEEEEEESMCPYPGNI